MTKPLRKPVRGIAAVALIALAGIGILVTQSTDAEASIDRARSMMSKDAKYNRAEALKAHGAWLDCRRKGGSESSCKNLWEASKQAGDKYVGTE